MMDLNSLELIRLEPDKKIAPFDCGDLDLNEFLLSDSIDYFNQLLAVTYLLEGNGETIAFFSVLNDKVSVADVDSGNKWKKLFKDNFPSKKKFKSYPAVKIGRLGVNNSMKGKGLGTALLDYIKFMFIDKNRTGCRFITVDAYNESLSFYEKNDFKYMTSNDIGSDTRLMYYDLSVLKRSLEESNKPQK